MIIKSKSYKNTACYFPVLDYILRESEQENGFIITKFIKGSDRSAEKLSQEYLHNEEYRKNRRKNNVLLYMDILSFHKDDAENLSNEALKKIVKKYISLRAPLSIVTATVHRNEKSHTHLHFAISGTQYRTGKSNRISRDDFKNKVKIPMEQFQHIHFPELKRSEIDHEGSVKKKVLIKDVEKQMELRGVVSEKQILLSLLEKTYTSAKSEQDFYAQLRHQNIELYSRNNKVVGIKMTRKFRFRTLGYTQDVLNDLNKQRSQSTRLEQIQGIRDKQKRRSKDKDLE